MHTNSGRDKFVEATPQKALPQSLESTYVAETLPATESQLQDARSSRKGSFGDTSSPTSPVPSTPMSGDSDKVV